MKIGIFGCTADPFTVAHYEIVNKVLEDKLIDKVIILPSIVKYYRSEKESLFSNENKKEIIKKWFEKRPDIILDFYEYDNIKESELKTRRYFNMLEDLKKRYYSENNTEFFTIIGGDSWNNIDTWYNWKELFSMTKFIVVRRNEHILRDFRINNQQVYSKIEVTIDKKFTDISASKVRERLIKESSSMSMGPNATILSLYLSDIETYKKTGKTYEEIQEVLNSKNWHIKTDEMEQYNTIDGLKELTAKDFEIDMSDLNKKIDAFIGTVKAKEQRNKIKLDSHEYESLKRRGVTFNDEVGDSLIANTPIFDVVKMPEVEKGFRPVKIKSKDWVTVIVESEGKLLVEKQLRYGLNKEFEEFPCGIIEKGEKPITAALRELEEETGIIPTKYTIKYLGKYAANPAFMSNYMHYFYITLEEYDKVEQKLDEHEHILEYYWKDKRKVFEEFCHSNGSSIMGCAWMLLMKECVLDEW